MQGGVGSSEVCVCACVSVCVINGHCDNVAESTGAQSEKMKNSILAWLKNSNATGFINVVFYELY